MCTFGADSFVQAFAGIGRAHVNRLVSAPLSIGERSPGSSHCAKSASSGIRTCKPSMLTTPGAKKHPTCRKIPTHRQVKPGTHGTAIAKLCRRPARQYVYDLSLADATNNVYSSVSGCPAAFQPSAASFRIGISTQSKSSQPDSHSWTSCFVKPSCS